MDRGIRGGTRPGQIDDGIVHEAAVRKHECPIGEQYRLLDVVGDEHHGGGMAVPQPQHEPMDLLLRERVEGTERFVEQEQFGIGGEGSGDGDALPLTAGELSRPRRRPVAETDLVEDRAGARGIRPRRTERDIRAHRSPGDQPRVLEHHRGTGGRRDRRGVVRGDEPPEKSQEGRLPGARAPEHGDELARSDRQRDVVEHTSRAEVQAGAAKLGDGGPFSHG